MAEEEDEEKSVVGIELVSHRSASRSFILYYMHTVQFKTGEKEHAKSNPVLSQIPALRSGQLLQKHVAHNSTVFLRVGETSITRAIKS